MNAGRLIMRMIRFIFSTLRRITKGAWILLFVMVLSLNVATLVSKSVFGVLSGIVETVFVSKSVRSRNRNELATANRKLASSEHRAARLESDLQTERQSSRILSAENDNLRQRQLRLQAKIDRNRVTYRGSVMPLRDAVADTSDRLARRVTFAATRNIASMPGEAIPIIGVAVIAAATTWEIHDACEMMKEIHELEVAFNPEAAILEREVCGMQVPTAAELWSSIKSSPGAVWAGAKGLYAELPEVSFSGTVNWFIETGYGIYNGIFG